MGETASAETPAPLDAEDVARANLYGLVGRLFYGPADPNLLAEIAQGVSAAEGEAEEGGLTGAWRALQDACRAAYPALIRQEYDTLFVGVGRAEVTPYLSAYAEPASPDVYLVRLRQQLAEWGLARRENVVEVEDHVSGISDVMRRLIEARHPLAVQRQFFDAFVHPGAISFCAAAQNSPSASFYRQVALFAKSFYELEKRAFEMEDTG